MSSTYTDFREQNEKKTTKLYSAQRALVVRKPDCTAITIEQLLIEKNDLKSVDHAADFFEANSMLNSSYYDVMILSDDPSLYSLVRKVEGNQLLKGVLSLVVDHTKVSEGWLTRKDIPACAATDADVYFANDAALIEYLRNECLRWDYKSDKDAQRSWADAEKVRTDAPELPKLP
jgi:hypothetical protein